MFICTQCTAIAYTQYTPHSLGLYIIFSQTYNNYVVFIFLLTVTSILDDDRINMFRRLLNVKIRKMAIRHIYYFCFRNLFTRTKVPKSRSMVYFIFDTQCSTLYF